LVSVAAASPLLAGWSAALTDGTVHRWWLPHRTSTARLCTVAGLAVVLDTDGVAARPYPAWVVLAGVGAVLIVVDAQVHLLPGRLVYPTAAVMTVVLAAAALCSGAADQLPRPVLAAVAVGVFWLIVAFLAPAAIGLGEVRVLALAAGLLGWASWSAVLYGQCLTSSWRASSPSAWLCSTRRQRGRRMPVPMGPAIIIATVLASWL